MGQVSFACPGSPKLDNIMTGNLLGGFDRCCIVSADEFDYVGRNDRHDHNGYVILVIWLLADEQ